MPHVGAAAGCLVLILLHPAAAALGEQPLDGRGGGGGGHRWGCNPWTDQAALAVHVLGS